MCVCCARARAHYTTHNTPHTLFHLQFALSVATSSDGPAVREQLAADSSQLRGRQEEPLPRALAGAEAAQIAAVYPLERSEMEVDADAGDSSGDITTGERVMK